MPLIYVTGAPGIGKSTILHKMIERNIEAYDLDDPLLGGPVHKATSTSVEIPPADMRTPEWFDQHKWRIDVAAIEALKRNATAKTILICGVAAEDEKILELFDTVIYLHLDDETLKERLQNREGNDYGKNDFEVREILDRKHGMDTRYADSAAIKIDASPELTSVVEKIITAII